MGFHYTYTNPQGRKHSNTPASGVLYVATPEGVVATQTSDGSLIIHGQTTPFSIHHNGTSLQIGRDGSATANLPATFETATEIPAGSSVIIEKSIAIPSRGSYWDEVSVNGENGRSVNQESMAIVQVPWGPQGTAVFRPPVLGSDILTQFLRNTPILESDVDLTKLPSVVVLPASAPSLEYLESKFEFYAGDHYSGWNTDTRTPGFQHPGYGSHMAGLVSEAMTTLCSTMAMEDKRVLATRMCQWGLDLAGAFASGRENWEADGGHMLGRTPLMILAGHLLGIGDLANPQTLFSANLVEADGNQYYSATDAWWYDSTPVDAWAKHWVRSGYVSSAPSTWTPQEIFDFSYIDQTVGAQVGSVLALRLMGLGNNMGASCEKVVEWFMNGGPNSEGKLDLSGVGLGNVKWGESYAIGSNAKDFCAHRWKEQYP